MKCAFLDKNGFSIRESEIPSPGTNEVLIKTASCGICEGDVFRYRTITGGGCEEQTPVLLGHEGSGVVVSCGPGAENLTPGDPVSSLCGAYAEYFISDYRFLAKLPAQISPAEALGEPIACCMHAAGRFGIKPGDRVAVIGCGYMGLICLNLANLMGAAGITAFDIIPWRLEVAKKAGASETVNTANLATEKIPGAEEYDVVIEAAGVQAAVDAASRLVRKHGIINLVGYHQSEGGLRTINMKEWNFKSITVVNGHVRNEYEKCQAMKAGFRLIAAKKLVMKNYTSDYAFTDIKQAFSDLISRKHGLYKANLLF
ncbi:MAG: hypothetical protein A2096_16175 [Spirochaetes bacterium GWF1_41_5]|nr:MAG: hypothetical protein A2096_16175 [Spirochaetes bacterium GWF1_41_5]